MLQILKVWFYQLHSHQSTASDPVDKSFKLVLLYAMFFATYHETVQSGYTADLYNNKGAKLVLCNPPGKVVGARWCSG